MTGKRKSAQSAAQGRENDGWHRAISRGVVVSLVSSVLTWLVAPLLTDGLRPYATVVVVGVAVGFAAWFLADFLMDKAGDLDPPLGLMAGCTGVVLLFVSAFSPVGTIMALAHTAGLPVF